MSRDFLQEFNVSKLVPVIALIAVSAASAQTAANKIGVINIQAAIVSTKEGQKAAETMQAKFGPKQKELEAKQAEIQALQGDLAKGSNTMSEAKRNEISRSIDTKTRELNRATEDAQGELEAEQQKVFNDLGGKLMEIINQYGKDNGYAVILDVGSQQGPVLFASNDVTKDIIDLYDKANAAPAPAAAKPPAAKPPAAPKAPPAK
jgi:outer membrane protein